MRRRIRGGTDSAELPVEEQAPAGEHDDFWEGPLGEIDHARAFDEVREDETLEYGARSPLDPNALKAMAELMALATWAEDKACRPCRTRMEETHDPAQLEHDECVRALRVARLLSRYPIG